jgi:RNA polymerase sigma-70 factor (ECF subfamily)
MAVTHNTALDNLFEKDISKLKNRLSEGYKTVFNLYAIEGYNHREIGEILGISEGTSKSQYSRAKASIREEIEKRA